MAEEKIIGIIVAVVLLSFLLLLGLNALGQVKGGMFNILNIGQHAMDKLDPIVVHDNCETWLNAGSDKFNPESILESYKIPLAFAPYDGFKTCCGEDLNKEAEDCMQPDSGCAAVPSDIVLECESACNSAIIIYNFCERQCNTDPLRAQCFDSLMSDESRPCTGQPENLRYRDCET